MVKRNSNPTVLLATYNGAAYLPEQIQSLKQQSLPVNIIARDDCSSDRTVEVLKAKHVDEVLVRSSAELEYGHLANFSALCEHVAGKKSAGSDSDYFLFADQDDVWSPQKVETLVQRIKELEQKYGKNTPILVHSDLRVVDDNLEVIADSFWRYQGLPFPGKHRIPVFLHQNVVTGCACAFNRELLNIATPIPQQALVHDFWFALVAETLGVVDFIDEPLIEYRQHGLNSIGALASEEQFSWRKKHIYKKALSYPSLLLKLIAQAQALEQRFLEQSALESKRSTSSIHLISKFAVLPSLGVTERLAFVDELYDADMSFKQRCYLKLVYLLLPLLQKLR